MPSSLTATLLVCLASFFLSLRRAAGKSSVKRRVEEGEGVPFFDDRLSCREDLQQWAEYSELVEFSRLRIYGSAAEATDLAWTVAEALASRTSNLTEVLQCTVGVISGYHLLARRHLSEGDEWKAYRSLQLALIWIFTLRNGLQVPVPEARKWVTQTDKIVHDIKALRQRLQAQHARRLAQLPVTPTSLRLPKTRIAIVSICAYPKDHPMVLRSLTPRNRQAYAERHGYALHVHMVHPMPGEDVHIQHSKLKLMGDYLRSGDYDWVAWFDCDSILMNFDRTLDAVIHRYARRSARPSFAHALEEDVHSSPPSLSRSANGQDEPGTDEELEAIVSFAGSCNTPSGCNASARLRLNRNVQYLMTVRTLLVDMAGPDEKLATVQVGGKDLGECNPSPDDDYDCGFFDCFQDVEVLPHLMSEDGSVLLEVQSVRTNNDCRCNLLTEECHSAAMAQVMEVQDGRKVSEPSFGLFVKFIFTPLTKQQLTERRLPVLKGEGQLLAECSPAGCCCNLGPRMTGGRKRRLKGNDWGLCRGTTSSSMLCSDTFRRGRPASALIRRLGSECIDGGEVLLGLNLTLAECLSQCLRIAECEFLSHGQGQKEGRCFWETGACLEFEEDRYTVYDVRSLRSQPGTEEPSIRHPGGCTELCTGSRPRHALIEEANDEESKDVDVVSLPFLDFGEAEDGIDLLITEEGWGFSSANWLIRRSNWSINFLDQAFRLCHEEMPLFGDQDAMIHLLLNEQALRPNLFGDPLDSHAVVVPQRELNAYDALNAHYMGCEGFVDGDLLVTFPGCKDPLACNPLFELAAEHAGAPPKCALRSASLDLEAGPQRSRSGAHIRLFGPPEFAGAVYRASHG